MSSSPPTNSSVPGAPEDRPRLSPSDLHGLRIWHESANVEEFAMKVMYEVRTVENMLHSIRLQLGVRDDAELREYIDRNGWPESYPLPPPPTPRPPPSREFTELLALRKRLWEELKKPPSLSASNDQEPGLDLISPYTSQDAFNQERLKWSDVWPGGEFRPRSPDEELLALLLRRSFSMIENFPDGPTLLITLDSEDPRVDAEARGRIFWALELEPEFAYWIDLGDRLPRLRPQADPRFLPGGSEFPRTLLRPRRHNLYTNLPYIFPNGSQCPSASRYAMERKFGENLSPPRHSHFSFSIGDWEGPDVVTVGEGMMYGPLCGTGSTERLHRNGTSWRSVLVGCRVS